MSDRVEILPRGGNVPEPGGAPIRVTLELWPREARARGTFTENGKTRDIEITSSPVVSIVLAYLRKAR